MAVSVDYTGRQADLFIFQGARPTGDRKITLSFGDGGGLVTAGLQKLSQSWAILFLTEKGSIPHHLADGSEFVGAVRFGRIRSNADVRSFFGLAAESVRTQLGLLAEQGKVPADERLRSAVLTDFNADFNSGKLTLFVKLSSQAGNDVTILLPVPVAIR
jgi:hypothetical protein